MSRPATLSTLLARTQTAIATRVGPRHDAARAMRRVAAALALPAQQRSTPMPQLLPACEFFHPAITKLEQHAPDLSPLADALRGLGPDLAWRSRSSNDPVFMHGPAHASIVGP